MNKRIFRGFAYTECEDFAEFLMMMAAKGWHFRGWKMGMIFEKGEPAEETYAVEVFTKGSEMDSRPEVNTEEFAEYCEVAGWEFIDSNRKFCVFRKKDENAVDIVTSEERFQNAAKAEAKMVLLQNVGAWLIAVIYIKKFFVDDFSHAIFYYSMIAAVLTLALQALYCLFYGVKVSVWYMKNKKRVLDGEKVYLGIGKEKQKRKYWNGIGRTAFLLLFLGITSYLDQGFTLLFPLVITLFLFVSCMCLIAYVRPSRVGNYASVLAVSIMIPVVLIMLVFGFSSGIGTYSDKNVAPLLQEDYREVDVEFMQVEKEQKENLFGEIEDYQVTYQFYNEKNDYDIWDEINYITYESEYSWVLNHIWNAYMKKQEDKKECAKLWGAEEAVYVSLMFPTYYVRYKNQIFVLKYEENLSTEQINIIRKKMDLGQVE